MHCTLTVHERPQDFLHFMDVGDFARFEMTRERLIADPHGAEEKIIVWAFSMLALAGFPTHDADEPAVA